jgi:coenzyme F420-reducing hydrogenase alpha subunit
MHRGDEFDFVEGSFGGTTGERHIHMDSISKIEGHGEVDISIKNGKVKKVKLMITEGKRFYTQAIRNKDAISLPLMTSRVCGTCSIAHLTCCAQAVENAFDYTPSDQTLLLRKLSLYGMMIRDHSLHLHMFCLPDIYGKDSVLDFNGEEEELIRKAFAVKGSGNNLSKVIAGRAVHATYAAVGKFSHIPDKDSIKKVLDELKSIREHAVSFIDIFRDCNFKFERETNFVSLRTKDYSFSGGTVIDSDGIEIPESDYWDYLDRKVVPYSEASGYEFEGKEYMVGALPRMNLNRESLHADTRRDAQSALSLFPSKNIYHNNLAQAIETLHCIDHSIELLESNEFKEEKNDPVIIKAGKGIGMLEAPRGTLFYMLEINKAGKVAFGNIIVPTQQNQIGMERGIGELVEQNLDKTKHEIQHEIEKLIRAYDPCMSCASHFLKVNWNTE